MTYQEFNYLYVKFTKGRSVRPIDEVRCSAWELKEFLEFSLKKIKKEKKRLKILNETPKRYSQPQKRILKNYNDNKLKKAT